MSDIHTANWSKQEFKAYLLIFAMQSNQVESIEELDFLNESIELEIQKKIKREISNDNDFQRIKKVQAYIKSNNLSDDELKALLEEIKNIFTCDDSFDAAEQGIYLFLERLFKI